MFGVQFLLFPISTTEKYFDQILTTFSGANTAKTAKVANRPG